MSKFGWSSIKLIMDVYLRMKTSITPSIKRIDEIKSSLKVDMGSTSFLNQQLPRLAPIVEVSQAL